jgi:hypothetical protein
MVISREERRRLGATRLWTRLWSLTRRINRQQMEEVKLGKIMIYSPDKLIKERIMIGKVMIFKKV